MSDSEDKVNGDQYDEEDEQIDSQDGMDELFGDSGESDVEGEGAEAKQSKHDIRQLDDSELDSADDEDRNDRMQLDEEDQDEGSTLKRELNVRETSFGRHAIPRGSDGETYHLKFPNNLGIEPKAFTLAGWKPPATDHHSNDLPSSNFSAFNTALNTIRWRFSPQNPSLVQSNARINRWNDGSLTLQFASHPLDQYELVPKSLNMPQVNPDTPTPTQIILPNYPANHQLKYDPLMDSHTYLAAPHEHATLIRHTNQITTSLTINSEEQQDDAVQRLQESMVALKKGSKKNADGGVEVISITEDPELAKKRAELAEKEKNAAQRKLQAQQEKAEGRANNVLRRSGLRAGMTGLTVGGLEDEDGMGVTKGRLPKPKSKRSRRRNSEYSDEEEELGRGRTREDEYDEDDGFLVGSDEEVEVEGDDDEEEEDDIDMDAEGEDDEEIVVKEKEKETDKEVPKKSDIAPTTPGARSKKRVIDDDEDE